MNRHNGQTGCKCATCDMKADGMTEEEIVRKVKSWEAECLEKYGLYVHAVGAGDDSVPTGYNVHSHGLDRLDGARDLQIIVPIPPQLAHSLVNSVAELVKNGQRFTNGQCLDKIIKGMQVKIIEAEEHGRPVHRIVLPDPQGELDEEKMDRQYAVQYQLTVEKPEADWTPIPAKLRKMKK